MTYSHDDGDREIRFKVGDTLQQLALGVKAAYERGDRKIPVSCEDYNFPDHVVMGGVWDSPDGKIFWGQAILAALEQIGNLPDGELKVVRNPRYAEGEPYSMSLEYTPLR
jgi:hypothetical protein